MAVTQKTLDSLSLNKGRLGELTVVIWNVSDPCTAYPDDNETTSCAFLEICPYKKEGKCKVQVQYMKYLFDSLIKDTQDILTQIQIHKIGLFLFPLYQHLIKFKMEAYGVKRVTLETEKGSKSIHPIFREIRETMKTIEGFYKSIGIGFMNLETPPDPESTVQDDWLRQHGDPDYYEREVLGNESATEGEAETENEENNVSTSKESKPAKRGKSNTSKRK
jgi:hypothetical protein